MKDPDNPNKPHPIIERFLIADAYLPPPLIQVKALYPAKKVSRNYWNQLFADTSQVLFINLIKKALNINQLTMNMIKTQDEWQLRKVKSFQFNKKNQTFAMNFAAHANATAIVKIAKHFIMKFKDVIQVMHHDDEILLCYGTYWSIYDAPISNDWINTGYASMDYVKANDMQYGWNFMNNINEPVFLIHDCLQLNKQIKAQMPPSIRNVHDYSWIQNMLFGTPEYINIVNNNSNKTNQLQQLALCHVDLNGCVKCINKLFALNAQKYWKNTQHINGIKNGTATQIQILECGYLTVKMD